MKKLVIVLIFLFAATALFANPIQLGTFPIGTWTDSNWSAVWEFSSNNIRILTTDGTVLHDFSTKTIVNFRTFLDGTNPGISFSCPEVGRSYRFIKPLTNTNVIMEIERADQPKYTVNMRRR